jgi:hypothetical protein
MDLDDDDAASRPRLILIAGLQKSGTSLLLRLLADCTGVAENPFDGIEGHAFWGNVPSHSPRAYPAGTIYTRHGGEAGHEISAAEADEEARDVLRRRLARLASTRPVIVNKSPYHSVRLPWLRALFPESLVVAVVRHAVPNVYSLMKKHLREDERDRPWREDHWYGVKPRGWRGMIDDAVAQCANQWSAVTRKVWEDRAHIDMIVGYRQLCREPRDVVTRILREAIGRPPSPAPELPRLACFDDEYRRGAPLRSKNELDRLDRIAPGPVELPALTEAEIARIRGRCAAIEDQVPVLSGGWPADPS